MQDLAQSISQSLELSDTRFGPGNTSSSQFSLDFQPFNKTNDRVFYTSDWTQRSRGKNTSQVAGGFAYKADDDHAAFNIVDNRPPKSRGILRFHQRNNQQQRNQQQQRKVAPTRTRQTNQRTVRPNQRGRFQNNYYRREEVQRGYSVVIEPQWRQIDNIPMQEIQTSLTTSITAATLLTAGDLQAHNSSLDSTRTAKPVPIVQSSAHYVDIPLAMDENIPALVAQEPNCFVLTDRVASLLMVSHLTVQPWDIQVKVFDNYTVMDVPSGSYVNCDPVDESIMDRLHQEPENMNSFSSLYQEATAVRNNVNHQFINVGTEPVKGDKPSPLMSLSPTNPSPIVYTYRKFTFDDFVVIVRCNTYAHSPSNPEEQLHFGTLFEFDPRWSQQHLDWRSTLEQQFGSTLANEAKNNTPHVMRIAAEATLSGADKIKLAWVSRAHSKDKSRHVLLQVSTHELNNFYSLLRARPSEMYGALSAVLNLVSGIDNGTYVLLREPMERSLSLFDTQSSADQDDVKDTAHDDVEDESTPE